MSDLAHLGVGVNSVLARLINRFQGYVEVGDAASAAFVLETIEMCARESADELERALSNAQMARFHDDPTAVLGMDFDAAMQVALS